MFRLLVEHVNCFLSTILPPSGCLIMSYLNHLIISSFLLFCMVILPHLLLIAANNIHTCIQIVLHIIYRRWQSDNGIEDKVFLWFVSSKSSQSNYYLLHMLIIFCCFFCFYRLSKDFISHISKQRINAKFVILSDVLTYYYL